MPDAPTTASDIHKRICVGYYDNYHIIAMTDITCLYMCHRLHV